MTMVLLVAAGGAAAAVAHYLFTTKITDSGRVLFLTLVGSGVLGFVVAASPPEWVLGLVGVGFLGSLAPMSSVALTTVRYARLRRFRAAAVFLAANVIGGIACAMFGYLSLKSGVTLYHKF